MAKATAGFPEREVDDPEDENKSDYQSAYNLLKPMFGEATAARLKAQLEDAPVVKRQALDIVRCACVKTLPPDDPQVAHFMRKIKRGKTPNPILLVQWRPLIIADGHHRTAAAFYVDPMTFLDCKVV